MHQGVEVSRILRDQGIQLMDPIFDESQGSGDRSLWQQHFISPVGRVRFEQDCAGWLRWVEFARTYHFK
jgi:hypothetical protein